MAWIRSARETRRAAEEMMALDDRMLSDIGLSRSEVGYAAQHGRLPRHEPVGPWR